MLTRGGYEVKGVGLQRILGCRGCWDGGNELGEDVMLMSMLEKM